MKARAILTAGALACTLVHAAPVETTPLLLALVHEYPDVRYAADGTQRMAELCNDLSQQVSTVYGLRLMGRTQAEHAASTRNMLVKGKLTAKQARIDQAVTAYVYQQPEKLDPTMDQVFSAARVLGEETLAVCRLTLEK